MSPLWFLLREIETAVINVTAWQCPGEENSPVAKGQIWTKATEFVTRKNKNKYKLINGLKGPYTSPRVRLPLCCNQTLPKVTWAAVSSSYMHKHWNEQHKTTNGTLCTANRSCQNWKQFAQTLLSFTFRFSQPSVLFEDSWGLSKGLQQVLAAAAEQGWPGRHLHLGNSSYSSSWSAFVSRLLPTTHSMGARDLDRCQVQCMLKWSSSKTKYILQKVAQKGTRNMLSNRGDTLQDMVPSINCSRRSGPLSQTELGSTIQVWPGTSPV